MRITNPCDDCKEKSFKCRIVYCDRVEEYHDGELDHQWLKQHKY